MKHKHPKRRKAFMFLFRELVSKVLTRFGVAPLPASIAARLAFHFVVRPIYVRWLKKHKDVHGVQLGCNHFTKRRIHHTIVMAADASYDKKIVRSQALHRLHLGKAAAKKVLNGVPGAYSIEFQKEQQDFAPDRIHSIIHYTHQPDPKDKRWADESFNFVD